MKYRGVVPRFEAISTPVGTCLNSLAFRDGTMSSTAALEPSERDAGDAPYQPVAQESALVLFNQKAGGVTAADRQRLLEALAEHGIRRFELIEPERLGPDVFKTAKSYDLFIVLGGDGTARAVAEHAPKDAPPLVLLPGGTLNVLPHALYGVRPWPEALKAALERGVVRNLSMGRANGDPFFVAAMFGAPTLLARAREAIREGRYLTAWRRVRHFLKRSFARSLRARPDDARMRKTEAVGVLCPSFSGSVEGDMLEWVRLDASRLTELVGVGLRALGGDWRADPNVELRACKTGHISSMGVIPATLDGEPKTYVSYVKIAFERRGPRVVVVDEER